MTAVDVTTATPPANYPPPGWREGMDANTLPTGWRDQGDYFYLVDYLRPFYSDVKAAPNPREVQRLYETFPMPGGGPVEVDALVLDEAGRYVKSDPVQRVYGAGAMFDPNKGWRQPMVKVDPRAGVATLPYRTWEHDVRLQRAVKAYEAAQTWERNYRSDLARVCPICGTANPAPSGAPFTPPSGLVWQSFRGVAFCERCLPAVEYAAAVQHYDQYRDRIDGWVDGHVSEHQPKPPRRHNG